MSISQPFEELQGWNSEHKLITPISIAGNYFVVMAAILEPCQPSWIFKMFIYQPFEEQQGWNSEHKLITPFSITGSYFETKKHGSHLGFFIYYLSYLLQPFWKHGSYLGFLKMSISHPFEKLQGWNSEHKLITPIYITSNHFEIKKWWSSWIFFLQNVHISAIWRAMMDRTVSV